MTITVFLGSLLGAMALGMPIAYALLVCGVALMLQLDMFDAQIIAQNIINGADSFPLMAVPFFMLAGEIMNTGGLSKRIVNLALSLIGHVRGGLGYVAIMAACILSALSGSAVADAAALSALLVPMMVKAGHGKATLGRADRSLRHHRAGHPAQHRLRRLRRRQRPVDLQAVPGRHLPGPDDRRRPRDRPGGGACARKPDHAAAADRAERWRAFIDSLWALGLPFIIIFGLKFGIFTPTEAGVVAAVYSLFVATVVYRELQVGELYPVFLTAAKVTAVVMFLVAASLVSAWLITVADLPGQVTELLEPLMDNQTLLMIAIMLLVVVVGTAMDMTPTILILTPVLIPVVKEAGIDPIYFGVLFIINNSIGLITPPVGTVLNVVAGVARINMDDLIKGVWPFMLAELIVLALLVPSRRSSLVPAVDAVSQR